MRKGDADGRIYFFGADSTVNSYDLAQSSRVVLPFTSRIGIESAMLGLPVVLSSLCFYADAGFCHSASTREEYESLIDQAIGGSLSPDAEAIERAHIAYYLIENCMELKSDFTPAPEDFERWVNISPKLLWKSANNSLIVKSLLGRVPLGVVNFNRIFQQHDSRN